MDARREVWPLFRPAPTLHPASAAALFGIRDSFVKVPASPSRVRHNALALLDNEVMWGTPNGLCDC